MALVANQFHHIQMTDNFEKLDEWYNDVFHVRRYADHIKEGFPYLAIEKRMASLVCLADTVIEPIAPAFHVEGWEESPLGKFFLKFKNHWHSLAFYTDELGGLWERLRAHDVRFYVNGGGKLDERPTSGAIFTHPKDTVAALEFMPGPMSVDPRFLPGWDSLWWAKNHPSRVTRLAYATIVTKDLEKAMAFYVDVLGGKLLHENDSPLSGTRNAYVTINPDTVIELAEPVEPESLAAKDLVKNGESVHAMTWQVTNLEDALAYFKTKGMQVIERDSGTALIDPGDTYGSPFRFTTWGCPGDPRDA
jgi:catechol 2,3-dioxygenase-like lactoylglutathione lyase family enzyme